MITNITHSGVFVLDQDEALDFYVGTLGLEVHTDLDLGFMRWLTVNVPGSKDREILLELAGGNPMHSADTTAQVRDLVTKGAGGGTIFFHTDDAQKTFDTLKAKGVEVTQELTKQDYGIDFGIRDPFGNHVRISQPV